MRLSRSVHHVYRDHLMQAISDSPLLRCTFLLDRVDHALLSSLLGTLMRLRTALKV